LVRSPCNMEVKLTCRSQRNSFLRRSTVPFSPFTVWLLVHNHWHAARSYQYNTIHKIEQTTLFCKSHLTFFSLVVRRTEVSFHGHEASLKTVWVHQQDLNSTSWAVAQPWPYHIKNRLLIIQTSNKRKLRKLTCFICSCYFTCRNANKQNRTNS